MPPLLYAYTYNITISVKTEGDTYVINLINILIEALCIIYYHFGLKRISFYLLTMK